MSGSADLAGAARARILIVDDEPFNVSYLEQELDELGYATETAATGVEALDRVAADPPDLILLDVMMPEMDGITALRILKAAPETRLIPVVLMTALNAREDRIRGIEAGADDFLTKPADERELVARIRTALAQKRTIDQTVQELRSTSDHLERHGRSERLVAVLALGWQPGDASLPGSAGGFLGRGHRQRAAELIRARGGTPSENPGSVLVAVFEGPDDASRCGAAVEAALAVLGRDPTARAVEENPPLPADAPMRADAPVQGSAAVSHGRALVGSTRISHGGAAQWVYAAEGEPVDRATALVRRAAPTSIVVTAEVAATIRARFLLEPDADAFDVLSRTRDSDEPGPTTKPERRVTTILVTDIVGSTRTVERLGDRAWAELVAAHERAVRQELILFGGREIDTTGDGFMLSFDSPASAVRCALAAIDRIVSLGMRVRVGIHTGEVEDQGGRLRGIAVHIANRIAASAGPGEILVSATTRELAAGSALEFTDRGERTLKGVSEPRRVFAVNAVDPDPATTTARPAARWLTDGNRELPAGLTAREAEVLRLVAMGLTDAEVATQLFLSVRTVNAHLRSVYRKVGVGSRAAAGRFAEENGLL